MGDPGPSTSDLHITAYIHFLKSSSHPINKNGSSDVHLFSDSHGLSPANNSTLIMLTRTCKPMHGL